MNDNNLSLVGWFFLCFVIFCAGCCTNIYRASIQSDVYRRSGIEVSTWEVLMGAKPVDRVITVK